MTLHKAEMLAAVGKAAVGEMLMHQNLQTLLQT